MKVLPYSDAHKAEWTAFVEAHPEGTIYHSIPWKRIVERTYGLRSAYHLLYDQGELVAVAPFFWAPTLRLRPCLLSVPYAPYAGPLHYEHIDIATMIDALGWFRERVLIRRLTPAKTDSVGLFTMRLQLPGDSELLWRGLSRDLRKQVRRAERAGLEFDTDGDFIEGFLSAYRVHMRRLGTPMHRPAFFRRMLTELSGKSALWGVKKDGEVVGAQLVLWDRGVLTFYTGFTLPRYDALRPGVLLTWGSMRRAIELGCTTLDYGRSIQGTGAYQHKLRWGTEPVALTYNTICRGEIREERPQQSRLLPVCWSHLPATVTDALGPRLRRFIQ